jgi:hypothetical protein
VIAGTTDRCRPQISPAGAPPPVFGHTVAVGEIGKPVDVLPRHAQRSVMSFGRCESSSTLAASRSDGSIGGQALCEDGVLAFRRLPGSRHRRIRVHDVVEVGAERENRREGRRALRAALDDAGLLDEG